MESVKPTKAEFLKAEPKKPFSMIVKQNGKKIYSFDNFQDFPFEVDPEYDLQAIKGWGTYSIVCLGKNNITGNLVAIKRIHKVFNDLGDTKRILRQIKILKFLKHRNIVGLKDILKIEDKLNFNEVYLCMEYMDYTLMRIIHSPQSNLDEEKIQFILYQLLSGIYFMHSADITHRDLKPDNILISKRLELKIADMNLAKKEIVNDQNTYYVTSRPYRAPEIFINPNKYTKAIDIWSVGCILAEMLGKTIIFSAKDFVEQIRKFVAVLGKPKLDIFTDLDPNTALGLQRVFKDIPDREKVDWKIFYPKASPKALDLLDNMLVYDPKARYTAEQCLNHPFLQTYRNRPRPRCQEVFDFSFDKLNLTVQSLRNAIYQQVQSFQQKKLARNAPTTNEEQNLSKKVKTQ